MDYNMEINIHYMKQTDTAHMQIPVNQGEIEKEGCSISLTDGWVRLEDGARIRKGHLDLQLHRRDPWDTRCLDDPGVDLYVELEELPERMTAMYMFNPWWTRPAFVSRLSEIPDRTQILFLAYADHYACILPLVGEEYKTVIKGGYDQGIILSLTCSSPGRTSIREELFRMTEGASLAEAIHVMFRELEKERGILPVEKRSLPEIFRYLGWCSWDAFYKEISADKLEAKARELKEKHIPVRWMLFDDGWMTGKEDMIGDYLPDRDKFPEGFRGVIDRMKPDSMLQWFGVWHAFPGYWAGVDPDSFLAREEKEHLYLSRSGRLIPDPEKGEFFYRKWYRILRDEGIDFVKVDGQSSIPFLYANDMSLARAAKKMHGNLERGSGVMDGQVINCMGMAMESILSRRESGLSRNSDDFCPMKENGFAEHLLQNAYNSLYHNELYHCDWDMFWTTHPDGEKHAIVRAISGGPIYFSDRIGETNPELIRHLVLGDGGILMMNHSARPTQDSIFQNPLEKGILKIQNTAGFMGDHTGGVLAAFNLTGEVQTQFISPKDIEGREETQSYWVYDYRKKKAFLMEADEELELTLEAGDYAYFILLPKLAEPVCLGLVDLYTGFAACREKNMIVETGRIAWLFDRELPHVWVNGEDLMEEVIHEGYLHILSLPVSREKCSYEFRLLQSSRIICKGDLRE